MGIMAQQDNTRPDTSRSGMTSGRVHQEPGAQRRVSQGLAFDPLGIDPSFIQCHKLGKPGQHLIGRGL
ncbi:MAG: hypothetical protein CFE34_01000 [Rhodobacteraceae bacterium PARR1]|nr:MAG: hypothetical protein CFE34_01000 [Rhodobacteraceae bacterium PARR1]